MIIYAKRCPTSILPEDRWTFPALHLSSLPLPSMAPSPERRAAVNPCRSRGARTELAPEILLNEISLAEPVHPLGPFGLLRASKRTRVPTANHFACHARRSPAASASNQCRRAPRYRIARTVSRKMSTQPTRRVSSSAQGLPCRASFGREANRRTSASSGVSACSQSPRPANPAAMRRRS